MKSKVAPKKRNTEGGLGKSARKIIDARNGKTVKADEFGAFGRRRMAAKLREAKARLTDRLLSID